MVFTVCRLKVDFLEGPRRQLSYGLVRVIMFYNRNGLCDG